MSIGAHRVTSAGTDLSCDVLTATIRHGRPDPTAQPEASSASLELPVELPAGLDVGSPITVDTSTTAGWLRRFTGTITDLGSSWSGADVHPVTAITAVGPLAGLGRKVVGDVPWPQELDGARVARILTLAGLPTTLVDPGTVQLLPRDVDAQAALDLLDGVAVDAAGLLWETRAGQVAYADAVHRRNTARATQLDACDVLLAPVWTRTVAGLVNAVTIRYGPAPEGSEQATYSDSRADSIAAFGRFAYSATTALAALADVQARAQLLLVRGGLPVWNLPALPVAMRELDAARTAVLLGLDVGDLLGLTGLPAGSPDTTVDLWVEGWTERLGYGVHDLTLAVSAYCRTVPPPQWDDVPPGWTWDTIGTMTWDAATCIGPQPTQGRWDDVPASTRWDTVPPATTWDTWS